MYLEVYPDIIFVFNFFIDFILLYLLKRINRKNSSIGRRLAASVLGAAAAAIVGIFPWMNVVIRFLLMNILSSVLMLFVAFGRMKKTDLLKQVITLYLITYFLGGFINSVYYHTNLRLSLIHLGNALVFSNIPWKFVIIIVMSVIPASVIILWIFRWYQSNVRETLDTELVLNERRIHTKGLLDTGNCLYDPIFKKPVIIIESMLLKELLTLQLQEELEKMKSYMAGADTENWDNENGQLLHLRIIPYQSVGNPKGMMFGLVLDKVVIFKGKETVCNEKVTAAICDNHLSTKEEYHVILHKELL